jgi:predicted metalloendopeptidase
MDAPTRAAALAKLAAAKNSMGYPDKWRNYDSLVIDRDSYLKSALAGHVFASKYQLAKIAKPVDRDEWDMPPFLVNAQNMPQFNQMRFPAGILQPPNFDASRNPAANYGAVGSVMGHELTHSFDDEGRRFDKKGDLKEWWSKKTAGEFERRAKCLEEQYSGYVTEGDLHINGKLTLGENIADQGGVKLAHSAWLSSERRPTSERTDSYTDDQVFFLAFAQVWCSKETPEFRKFLTNSNAHSLPKYRVIGTLSNIPQFAAAFSCKAGDKMVPKNSCAVW